MGVTDLVSDASDGGQANGSSGVVAVSGDGRYVAFESDASNLVAGDGDGKDLFVWDLVHESTTWILNTDKWPAWGWACPPDGRYLSFTSSAPDIVADDTNGDLDVFVLDRQTGTAQRASVGTGVRKRRRAAAWDRCRPSAASSRSPPHQQTSCRAIRTTAPTSSSMTC